MKHKIILAFLCSLTYTFSLGQSVTSFTATIAYNSQYANGDYTIYMGFNNSIIDKPVIIVEGFDPTNLRSGAKIYELFNTDESVLLANRLRTAGYDIIILNFADGADYIQKNAYLVVKLIEIINQQKTGNEQLVVAGASMGGLVTRYALTYMETPTYKNANGGKSHNTRLFVSFDSPQHGANVPLGVQHFIASTVNPPISAAPYLAISVLNRPAAQQMLEYHYTKTAGNPGTPLPHSLKDQLYSELFNLNGNGFPQNCRKVAIANGNKTSKSQKSDDGTPTIPGMLAFHYSVSDGVGSHSGDVSFVPAKPPLTPNAHFIYSRQSILLNADKGIITEKSRPLDNSPGGYYPYVGDLADAIRRSISSASVVTKARNSSFIPTTSALALNVSDVLYNIASDKDILCKTPFHAFYAPFEDNQEHVALPTITANWLFDQINTAWTVTNRQFNFGKNTNSFIFSNTVVDAGGTLSVNSNTFTDYSDNPLAYLQAPPIAGSTFEVLTPSCVAGVNITVRNGGKLVIGDNTANNNRGVFRVRSGSTLELGGNGTASIHANSQLILESGATLKIKSAGKLIVNNTGIVKIEPGAKLIYEPNAQIQLLGDDAVLEIQGELQIESHATFTFTYPNSNSGYVRFSAHGYFPTKNIKTKDFATILFNGQGQNDKILEITQETLYIPDGLGIYFRLSNGTAGLGTDARLSVPSRTLIQNAKITSLGIANSHRGLVLFGQAGVNINNSIFERGLQGI